MGKERMRFRLNCCVSWGVHFFLTWNIIIFASYRIAISIIEPNIFYDTVLCVWCTCEHLKSYNIHVEENIKFLVEAVRNWLRTMLSIFINWNIPRNSQRSGWKQNFVVVITMMWMYWEPFESMCLKWLGFKRNYWNRQFFDYRVA